jgi:hypothetical protein
MMLGMSKMESSSCLSLPGYEAASNIFRHTYYSSHNLKNDSTLLCMREDNVSHTLTYTPFLGKEYEINRSRTAVAK